MHAKISSIFIYQDVLYFTSANNLLSINRNIFSFDFSIKYSKIFNDILVIYGKNNIVIININNKEIIERLYVSYITDIILVKDILYVQTMNMTYKIINILENDNYKIIKDKIENMNLSHSFTDIVNGKIENSNSSYSHMITIDMKVIRKKQKNKLYKNISITLKEPHNNFFTTSKLFYYKNTLINLSGTFQGYLIINTFYNKNKNKIHTGSILDIDFKYPYIYTCSQDRSITKLLLNSDFQIIDKIYQKYDYRNRIYQCKIVNNRFINVAENNKIKIDDRDIMINGVSCIYNYKENIFLGTEDECIKTIENESIKVTDNNKITEDESTKINDDNKVIEDEFTKINDNNNKVIEDNIVNKNTIKDSKTIASVENKKIPKYSKYLLKNNYILEIVYENNEERNYKNILIIKDKIILVQENSLKIYNLKESEANLNEINTQNKNIILFKILKYNEKVNNSNERDCVDINNTIEKNNKIYYININNNINENNERDCICINELLENNYNIFSYKKISFESKILNIIENNSIEESIAINLYDRSYILYKNIIYSIKDKIMCFNNNLLGSRYGAMYEIDKEIKKYKILRDCIITIIFKNKKIFISNRDGCIYKIKKKIIKNDNLLENEIKSNNLSGKEIKNKNKIIRYNNPYQYLNNCIKNHLKENNDKEYYFICSYKKITNNFLEGITDNLDGCYFDKKFYIGNIAIDIKFIEDYKIKHNIFYYTNNDNKGNINNINNKGKDLGIINLDGLFYYDSNFIIKNIINGIGVIDITKVKKYKNGFIIGDESGKVIFMKLSGKSNINVIDEIQLPGSIIDIHINKYILVSTSNHVLYRLKISCNKIFIKKEINLSARVCAIGVKKYIFAQCSNNKMYILNRKLEILKIIDEKIGYAMKSDVNLIKGNLDGTITEYNNRKKYKNEILEEKDYLVVKNSIFLRNENKVHNKAIFALDAYKGNIVSGGDDHLVVYDNKKYIYGDIPILDIRCVSNGDCFNVFVCYRNKLLILDKDFKIKNEKIFYFIAQAFEMDEKYAYIAGNGFIRYKIKNLI